MIYLKYWPPYLKSGLVITLKYNIIEDSWFSGWKLIKHQTIVSLWMDKAPGRFQQAHLGNARAIQNIVITHYSFLCCPFMAKNIINSFTKCVTLSGFYYELVYTRLSGLKTFYYSPFSLRFLFLELVQTTFIFNKLIFYVY